MPYRLRLGKPAGKSVQRVAREQIDRGIAELERGEIPPHEAVHQVRKRCKKIRGLLRLVRDELGDAYSSENAFFRDAAADISRLRDAQAHIEAFDRLVGERDEADGGSFEAVRNTLVQRRDRVAEQEERMDEKIACLASQLREARERVGDWRIRNKGFRVFAPGLQRTYQRGREAMMQAYASPSEAAFHELRKRVKYHWYHVRLLQDLWQPLMGTRRKIAKTLSDLLGDEHDLTVLRQTLLEAPDEFGADSETRQLLELIDCERTRLRNEAEPDCRRLYAEKPKAVAKRFRSYWKAARR